MTTTSLTRAAGISAAVAGLIFIGVQINHPPMDVSSVTSTEWAVRSTAKLVMSALALAGITGMYLRQVRQAGVLGLVGYLLLALRCSAHGSWPAGLRRSSQSAPSRPWRFPSCQSRSVGRSLFRPALLSSASGSLCGATSGTPPPPPPRPPARLGSTRPDDPPARVDEQAGQQAKLAGPAPATPT